MDSGNEGAVDFCILTNRNIRLKYVKFRVEIIYVLHCDVQQAVSDKGSFPLDLCFCSLGETPRQYTKT